MCVRNSLVDMYAKCGNMEDAQRVFNKMLSHDVPVLDCHHMGTCEMQARAEGSGII
jgi:pentatricopeptide repeat protein